MTNESIYKPLVGVIGLTGQSLFMRMPKFAVGGETVMCDSIFFEPGGKGHNQAVACSKMGVEVIFLGSVGDDAEGDICFRTLTEAEVTPKLVVYKGERTAFATICVDHTGCNQVYCYTGAGMMLKPQDIKLTVSLEECAVLLTQMEISDDCICEVLSMGQRLGIPVILNPAPARLLPLDVLAQFYALTPNEHEARILFGIDVNEEGYANLAARIADFGLKRVAVTLGDKGVLVVENSNFQIIPPLPVATVVDTTGAGDIFNGSLAALLAEGAGFTEAVRFAVAASGLSVCKRGVADSIPSRTLIETCRQTHSI